MSRGLSSPMLALASSPSFPPAYFVELDWPTGTIRAWTGYGTMTWGGNDWLGTGLFGKIGDISESSDGSANTLAIQLSGIPSAQVALALRNDSMGRSAVVYLGALSNGVLVSDPIAIFGGFIDFCVIADDGTTATITVNLAKDFTRNNVQFRRYTDEDQRLIDPTDAFFSLLAGNAGKEFSWGHVVSQPTAGGGGGAGSGGDNTQLD